MDLVCYYYYNNVTISQKKWQLHSSIIIMKTTKTLNDISKFLGNKKIKIVITL